jgi:hypothetical protein
MIANQYHLKLYIQPTLSVKYTSMQIYIITWIFYRLFLSVSSWHLASTLQSHDYMKYINAIYIKCFKMWISKNKKNFSFSREKKGNTQKQFSVLDRGTFKIAFFPFFQLIYFCTFWQGASMLYSEWKRTLYMYGLRLTGFKDTAMKFDYMPGFFLSLPLYFLQG